MITAQMVKELREKTGAGMMDCKKALGEARGDMDKAAGIIRKKGMAVAVQKADRITAEGVVEVYVSNDNKSAGIVEFNCETDFVAANSEFITLAKNLARQAAVTNAANTKEFMEEKYIADANSTVKEAVTALIAKLGENMSVRKFEKFTTADNIIQSYIHGGGRIGAVVELACAEDSPVLLEVAKTAAMQVAAANPLYLDPAVVDEDVVNEKRKGYKFEALNEGKPENIAEKVAEGKLRKYFTEVCLLKQQWVKNPDYTIAKYLQEKSKEVGTPISIVKYIRYERGEGIKKEENFAEAVKNK